MADYYKFKNNNTNRTQYQASKLGKVSMYVTVPAAIITVLSLVVGLAGVRQAFAIMFIGCAITIVGCILLAVDIIVFNRKQAKKNPDKNGPKEMDIGRMVHLLIGVVVGIIIGYLIWGAKFR
ncbi:MAG: hypothetical protein K6E58_06290 [Eubacterium sp.]|nr:hypothetical protein [Eubacterium sp.]